MQSMWLWYGCVTAHISIPTSLVLESRMTYYGPPPVLVRQKMMCPQVHHLISGNMELGLGRYPARDPSVWQLHILPCVLAGHQGPLVFGEYLHGPFCAVSVAMVFRSLLFSVLLMSGPVALEMLLLLVFVFAFSNVFFLVFVGPVVFVP